MKPLRSRNFGPGVTSWQPIDPSIPSRFERSLSHTKTRKHGWFLSFSSGRWKTRLRHPLVIQSGNNVYIYIFIRSVSSDCGLLWNDPRNSQSPESADWRLITQNRLTSHLVHGGHPWWKPEELLQSFGPNFIGASPWVESCEKPREDPVTWPWTFGQPYN